MLLSLMCERQRWQRGGSREGQFDKPCRKGLSILFLHLLWLTQTCGALAETAFGFKEKRSGKYI